MFDWQTSIRAVVKGYTGGEAEMRITPKGNPVTNFSIAVGGGERFPVTWVRCTVWGDGSADRVQKAIDSKGLAIEAEGRMVTKTYEGKSGRGFSLELTLDKLTVETAPKSGKMEEVNVVPDDTPETVASEGEPKGDPLVTAKSKKE